MSSPEDVVEVLRKPPAGSRPGTLVVDPSLPAPRIDAVTYDAKELTVERDVAPERMRGLLVPGHVTWFDVQGLGDAGVLEALGAAFAIHPLALEDLVNVPIRPKTEEYDQNHLLVARVVRPAGADGWIGQAQVSLILGDGWVMSFQERPSELFAPILARIQAAKGPLRRSEADYLAYALLDTVVDSWFAPLEDLGDELLELEEEVLADDRPDMLRRINRARSLLASLRRAAVPQRDALMRLTREEDSWFGEQARLFLRDTYDHATHVAESIEGYREQVSALMNTHMSVVSNRMNEVMKLLTLVTTVFVPLSFLAGIYGMNFEHMPELGTRWGYFVLLGVMGVAASGMFVYFRHRGWIGRRG